MANRKLIRPSLTELRDQGSSKFSNSGKKKVPPEQTNAEQYYYLKQMTNKTPVVVTLTDGEELRGVIEWYDKHCIKVNRDDAPNLLVQKSVIKYIFKQEEETRSRTAYPSLKREAYPE